MQGNWENYEFISSTDKTIVLQEGYEPPIHDFSISIDDFDYTSTILEQENALLFICYNINKTEDKSFDELNKLYDSVVSDSLASFIPLSASGYDDLQSFKLKNNVAFDFYFTDETTLKTIVRSNPGLVLLNKGTIVAKWHLNDIPDYESIKNLFIK